MGHPRLVMSDEHVRESPPQPTRETATGGASRAMLEYGWGSCDLSRRYTYENRSATDWWSVTEATMRTAKVVVVEPGSELAIAFE